MNIVHLTGKFLAVAVALSEIHGQNVKFARTKKTVLLDAGQAAVSLENARLYDEQRSYANSFARFVPSEFFRILGHPVVHNDFGRHDTGGKFQVHQHLETLPPSRGNQPCIQY